MRGQRALTSEVPAVMAASSSLALPMSGIRHRRPRFGRSPRVALLQKLDRVKIRRAHKGHLAVTRRSVDGDAKLHQAIAGRIDIVDLIGEVTEVTILAVFLLVPVVGEFNQRRAASF